MHYKYVEKELDDLLKKENNNFKTVAFTRKELKKIKESFCHKNHLYQLLDQYNNELITKSMTLLKENEELKKKIDELEFKRDTMINIQDGI